MPIPTLPPMPTLADRARQFAQVVRDDGWVAALRRVAFHIHGLIREPGPLAVYTQWIARFDRPRDARAPAPAGTVHVTVLVPLAPGQPEQAASRTLASLTRQSHPQWEAWLVTRDHGDPMTDAGWRVIGRSGVSPAEGIATRRFVTRVQPEDALHPLALARLCDAVSRQPEAAAFYGDQDAVDDRGRRHSPYFKPEADLDLLLAQDYLSKGAFVDAGRLEACGGPAALAFSPHAVMLELLAAKPGIQHVRHILYHHRSPRQDAAYPGADPVRGEAAAVAAFLAQRESGGGRVVEENAGYRVRWPLPSPPPRVSVVIPVRDRAALLRNCVDGLLHATDYPDIEVLIVDNGSVEPETLELLRTLHQLDNVHVLAHPGPFNFSAINNRAVRHATGSLVLLLNNDVEILEPGWMAELVSQACRAGVGAVGALLLYPDRTIQHAGVVLGLHGVAGHPYAGRTAADPGQAGRLQCVQSLSAVTAACLMVRKSLYQEVGGLDEALAVAFNDVDFCLRLGERGLRTVWTPYARLLHHESASRGRDTQPHQQERLHAEIARFRERWGACLDSDRAYHPALSLDGEAFCVSLSRRQYDAALPRQSDPTVPSHPQDAIRR